MNKKTYEKPAMNIVMLQQQAHLLAGSGGLGDPDDYGNGGDPLGF